MRICMIGSGNVGTRLGLAFHAAGHTITGVYSRDLSRAKRLGESIKAPGVNDFDLLDRNCDVVVLAVYDDAIESVYHSCKDLFPTPLFAHTAGSVPVSVFQDRAECGAIWPVQTLSKGHDIAIRNVPIAITGNSPKATEKVLALATSISDQVYSMTDAQRLVIHLCATFANNFSNHMYAIAEQVLTNNEIPFEILRPIIRETAAKVQRTGPREAQTGAAIRGDITTMEKHLKLLEQQPDLADLYLKLSESIRKLGK